MTVTTKYVSYGYQSKNIKMVKVISDKEELDVWMEDPIKRKMDLTQKVFKITLSNPYL